MVGITIEKKALVKKAMYKDVLVTVRHIILVLCVLSFSSHADVNELSQSPNVHTAKQLALVPAVIEIETDADSFIMQAAYQYHLLGKIKFTPSATAIGLHQYLLQIMDDSEVGKKLIQGLSKKGGAIVWEAARLESKGDLVLPQHIFGYMDKNRHQSGLMSFNQGALKYIVIDVTPISHETTQGESRAELKNIMAHEAIHALLPHQNLMRHYKNGRILNELFTMLYTNKIRQQRNMPLRSSYGDAMSKSVDDLIHGALARGVIDSSDLVADLELRLSALEVNALYDPTSINEYGVSKRMLSLLKSEGFLERF